MTPVVTNAALPPKQHVSVETTIRSGWLLDPETREPLPGFPDREREIAYRASHWEPGWRSGILYENGVPVRMWFGQCLDPCCADYRASLPPLESLRG